MIGYKIQVKIILNKKSWGAVAPRGLIVFCGRCLSLIPSDYVPLSGNFFGLLLLKQGDPLICAIIGIFWFFCGRMLITMNYLDHISRGRGDQVHIGTKALGLLNPGCPLFLLIISLCFFGCLNIEVTIIYLFIFKCQH